MNYADIKKVDVANGPGVRVSLFVSGCTHACKGCFNSIAWDFNYGKKFTKKEEKQILELLRPDHISGFSVLGGEPLQQDDTLLHFLEKVKKTYPQKTIWLYTGYCYEDVKDREIMKYIDVLVDGKFVEEKKQLNLAFRGSSNQRVIDVKQTIQSGKICQLYI